MNPSAVSDAQIDELLIENLSEDWRKVAYVVGLAMLSVEPEFRRGRDDRYFAERLHILVACRRVEAKGALRNFADSEVRLNRE